MEDYNLFIISVCFIVEIEIKIEVVISDATTLVFNEIRGKTAWFTAVL